MLATNINHMKMADRYWEKTVKLQLRHFLNFTVLTTRFIVIPTIGTKKHVHLTD